MRLIQHLPDSTNRPGYPSAVLLPGERSTSRTEFRFTHLPRVRSPVIGY